MVYIDAVRHATDENGNKLYISDVKWTSGLNEPATEVASKQDMIDFIELSPGVTKTKFFRDGVWVVGEDVHVVDDRYLRTDANDIPEDNLGNLPEF